MKQSEKKSVCEREMGKERERQRKLDVIAQQNLDVWLMLSNRCRLTFSKQIYCCEAKLLFYFVVQ